MATKPKTKVLRMGAWKTGEQFPDAPKRIEDELDHIQKQLEVETLVLDIVGSRVWDIDVREICTRAEVVDVMKGSPSLEFELWDPEGDLRNSGRFDKTIDIHIGGGRWYRLAQVKRADGGMLTLVFESRWSDRLKRKFGPMKQSRSKGTRAEFILAAIRKVAGNKVEFICPELKKKQPIGKIEKKKKKKKKERKKGFGPGDKDSITVKGSKADSAQIDNIERVIEQGERMGASDKVKIGAIMTITQESNASRWATNGQFVGLFQQSKAYGWPASRNPEKDAKAWYAKAIKIDKDLPQTEAAIIARKVQMNNLPAHMPPTVQDFQQWKEEATNTFSLYKGGSTTTTTSKEYYKKYEFEIEEDQNFWDGILELAEEVNWALWINKNTIWYMSEDDLYKSAHRGRISEADDGIISIRWDQDDHKRVNEATVTADMDRWPAPIGSVVVLDNEGPANGRWLVTEIRKSLFDWTGTIELEKPTEPKPEPAPTSATKTTTTTEVDGKDIEGYTPKEIIDKIVIPLAREHLGTQISAESVWEANRRHGPTNTGNRSDHQGPPSERWAADMSHGSAVPTKKMDNLANAISETFGIGRINMKTSGAMGSSQDVKYVDTKRGFKYQLIYRSTLGGNHDNHVHFGIQALNPTKGGNAPGATPPKKKTQMSPRNGKKPKPKPPPRGNIPDFQ